MPSKGPISLSCPQVRGSLLSRGTVPPCLPAPFPVSVTPIPIYSLPTPILTPFLAVQALSFPKLSRCRGW